MAFASANGQDLLAARVALPRVGVWHADIATAKPDGSLSGAISISLNGVSFKGTARRSGSYQDTPMARVVGGAGGFGKSVNPKQYRIQPCSVVVADILSSAGETLSGTSDQALLASLLPFWVLRDGKAGPSMVSLLCEFPGASWRVLADGTVWVGYEAWPASGLKDFEALNENPIMGNSMIYAEQPNVFPGEVFGGSRVSYVDHHLSEHVFRTTLWYEAP